MEPYYALRLPDVTVKGRISNGQNTAKVAGAFISLCQANTRGLTVETTQPTREGRGGKDGVFEIEFVGSPTSATLVRTTRRAPAT